MSKARTYNRKRSGKRFRQTGSNLAQEAWKTLEGQIGPDDPRRGLGEAILAPTPERTKHEQVEISSRQIVDSDGNIGVPFRTINVIDNLRKAGKISNDSALAALDFSNDFYRAGLVGIKAAPLERVGVGREYITETKITALDEVWKARYRLGVGTFEDAAAWHILGLWRNISEWSSVAQISHRKAESYLISAIEILSRHYGYI